VARQYSGERCLHIALIMWRSSSALSSTIIEDVLKHCGDNPELAIAYFYFDFQNREKQQCHNLLRSLIAQFLRQSPQVPQRLDRLHSDCAPQRRDPDVDDLTTVLMHIVQEPRQAYIIIDALDECTEREQLLDLMEKIVGWKISTVHMLVTSRKEREIEDRLLPLCWHTMALRESVVAGDIVLHVHECLQNDSKLKKWPKKVQAEIQEALTNGSQGMYADPLADL
jgi:hypothetical protein